MVEIRIYPDADRLARAAAGYQRRPVGGLSGGWRFTWLVDSASASRLKTQV
jgi:hypothetical protein